MVALQVWLAVHTHEGAQHSPARSHWPAPCVHSTLHGTPVGLAQHTHLPHMHVGIITPVQSLLLYFITYTVH